MWVVPFPSVSLNRLALSPFTFSNGVTVPAGTYVAVPMNAAHRDERIYANADGFDGFRFTKLRESEGDAPTSRHHGHMVSTSTEQLSFGLGRHAWQAFLPSVYHPRYDLSRFCLLVLDGSLRPTKSRPCLPISS
jgi:hypothetical protein